MNARTTSRRSWKAGAKRSCKGRVATGTDAPQELEARLADLGSGDWRVALDAVTAATSWLETATPGDSRTRVVVARLVALATHPKWEVRRAVAGSASKTLHPDFGPVLVRLAADHNARVRQAAEAASLRRRDWGSASALGKAHEDRINATLDDIEGRFGARARIAVKRASEHVAHTFAREIYHEVIRLLSPLAASADRLVVRLGDEQESRAALVEEAARMKQRVARLRSVLDAMRTYTAPPDLTFAMESVREVIDESAAIVRDGHKHGPSVHVDVTDGLRAEICRARVVQALTNVVANAVDSYDGLEHVSPITITAFGEEERVVITVEDRGCGMNEEALADATVLFTTSKEHGTGFGLPLAVKIIQSEHNGSLELESRKGYGTKVRVIVPVLRHRERP